MKLYKISFVLLFGFPFYFKITLTNQILLKIYLQFWPNASHEEMMIFFTIANTKNIVFFSLDDENYRILAL